MSTKLWTQTKCAPWWAGGSCRVRVAVASRGSDRSIRAPQANTMQPHSYKNKRAHLVGRRQQQDERQVGQQRVAPVQRRLPAGRRQRQQVVQQRLQRRRVRAATRLQRTAGRVRGFRDLTAPKPYPLTQSHWHLTGWSASGASVSLALQDHTLRDLCRPSGATQRLQLSSSTCSGKRCLPAWVCSKPHGAPVGTGTIFTAACMQHAPLSAHHLLSCMVLNACPRSRYFACTGGSTAHADESRAMVRYLL